MLKQWKGCLYRRPFFIIETHLMKKKTLLAATLASSLFAACSSSPEKESIEQAAYNYCVATSNYDLDAAEAFCTEETAKHTLAVGRHLLTLVDSSYIASDTPATIEIKSVKQLSDTSAYAVYHKQTPRKDYVDTMQMRKRDGQWLAHSI